MKSSARRKKKTETQGPRLFQKNTLIVLVGIGILLLVVILIWMSKKESNEPVPSSSLKEEPLTREQLIETSSGEPGQNISQEEEEFLQKSSSGKPEQNISAEEREQLIENSSGS